ncbi:MFS transporter [Acinetobacter sp. ANC 4204]|uniref:MFS transporter n=1 Tax=Acinetobacter sp. ANC 4204 TaxID=1977884 RepID=UPI000A33B1E0|nr:MFS transporter [Acinetobacter sp. ANC 4204]OTG60261.1 MFS transporter [Acinetobacter sp. ANC 4204]
MKLSSSIEADWSTFQQPIPQTINKGTREYKKAGMALFLLGFASFSLIYCVQPLLPNLSQSFHIAPSASALALSLTTGFLAMSIVLSSAFSQTLGRKGLMFFSMLLASILNVVCAVSPSWHVLMLSRSLEGFVLGGVPAVAMAWIAEEISPKDLAKTMGLYIAGTAFGGMMGRVGMGILTEFFSWRISMAILGGICLFCALGFLKLLPNSRNFTAQQGLSFKFHLHAWYAHLSHTRLLKIYVIGFLLTSIFVTLFNYVTFRLFAAPYHLSQTQISLIFLSYSLGIISSSIADRVGKKQVMILGFSCMLLGVLLTLSASLFLIILGIGCVTTGFFIAHAIASSRVGELATSNKGHATSLYLLFYYLGSSIIGAYGGNIWQSYGWNGIVILNIFLILIALIVIFSIKPLHSSTPTP